VLSPEYVNKVSYITLRVTPGLHAAVKEAAVRNTRTFQGQAMHYIKIGLKAESEERVARGLRP